MDKKRIGQRIAELRKAKGLTQRELAERLNVTDKSVSKWETGVNFPDIAILENLAKELDTTVTDLLGLEQATSEETIKGMAEISIEEKEKIKKEIRKCAWCIILLMFFILIVEFYFSWRLYRIGLEGGIYGICTTGLAGFMGTIIGCGLYTLRNLKKI